jgi:excinuclease ABC subunit C
MQRLLAPSFAGTKRLHLGGRVTRLSYSQPGSQFATSLLLLRANREFYGSRATERLHLRAPALLRMASDNPYPRVYVTTRATQRALASTFGPFPSRTAAERFLDESLNLFALRRCTPDLHPDPAFPGCVYSEMKMCLAPCFRGCTDRRYAEETARVRDYLASRGDCTIAQLAAERDRASANLDFEEAARLHLRIEKVKAAAQQAAPLVHPIASLDALIVQPAGAHQTEAVAISAKPEKMSNRAMRSEADGVALFLVRGGRIAGPGFFSVEGMRHPNERAGSTSLFAHPTLLEPTPLESPAALDEGGEKLPKNRLEDRLQQAIKDLDFEMQSAKVSADELSAHLSLLARWYYRPAARRTGEIFFRDEHAAFPLARILRGISRVFCGHREAAGTETSTAPAQGAVSR